MSKLKSHLAPIIQAVTPAHRGTNNILFTGQNMELKAELTPASGHNLRKE